MLLFCVNGILSSPFRLPPSQGFETPVATRVRARPQSWHGMNPPGSMGVNGRGAMLAPMSAKQGTPRAADHMLFYSVCQATFYVLCFRGEELGAMDDFGKQVGCFDMLACLYVCWYNACGDIVPVFTYFRFFILSNFAYFQSALLYHTIRNRYLICKK